MDPGVVPVQLQVSTNMSNIDTFLLDNYTGVILRPHDFFHAAGLDSGRGDADISAVLPIMTLYQLPQGQYGYSGHVINLPQDVASFVNSLP